MPFVPAPGIEPITGYQLVEKLGMGGYGAVWKTTAPGGLMKAIKIVFGDKDSHQAEQELKALRRMKEVRHPFLLSLERYEIIDGQLFIVTELADKSLLDRFDECRQAGLRGIPRMELLGHLRDAAEALDYMGETYGLQHLDIKPQNLLLVGGRIKVADFGLVKDLVGTSVTATGGVTPIYATPEAFDGRVSRHSDQYSLAVVYEEMLTGARPFPGTTVLQLAAQHMNSRPLLDPLPPHDRPIIGRSLSKNPESRFPTCREMIEQLLRIRDAAPAPAPSLDQTPHPTAEKHLPRETVRMRRPRDAEGEGLPGAPPGQTPAPAQSAQESSASGQQIDEPIPEGQAGLRPTLFLGMGGLACATLKRLRSRLHRRFGRLSAAPILRFLLVDTDRAHLRAAQLGEAGEALDSQETLLTPLRPAEQYRDQSRAILRWLDRRWLYGIPRSLLTEGRRPLGALALVDNAAAVLARLRECLSQITDAEAKARTASRTGMPLRDETPRIYIVASIAGATGGGMLAAMAYAVRQVLREMRLSSAGLSGILLHATSQKPAEMDVAIINGYATLNELYHYSLSDQSYPGNPECGLAAFSADHPPFQDTYLVPLGDQLDQAEAEAATDIVAEYLDLDAATPAGTFLDRYRYSTHPANCERGDTPVLRCFGLSRVCFPRRQLETQAVNLFCHNLVETWPDGTGNYQAAQIKQDAEAKVTETDLRADALIARLRAAAETMLGEDADSYFPKLAATCSAAAGNPTGPSTGSQPDDQVLRPIESALGAGPDLRDGSNAFIAPWEKQLHEQAQTLGDELGRSLTQWLLETLEDPDKGLNAADQASGWVAQHVISETRSVRTKLGQMQSYRDLLRRQLTGGSSPEKGTGGRWSPAILRPKITGKPNPKLLEFCWARFGEAILESTETLLSAIARCVDQFTQDALLCRQRLAEFAALFPAQAAVRDPAGGPALPTPHLCELFPGRADNVGAAAERIIQYLPHNLIREFDETLQEEVLRAQNGSEGAASDPSKMRLTRRTPSLTFWGQVSQNRDLAADLKEKLQARVRPVIVEALKNVHVADLFLASHDDSGQAEQALIAHVRHAQPRLGTPAGWQHLLVTLPQGSPSETLHQWVNRHFPDVSTTVLHSEDEIAFLFEAAQLPVQDITETLIGGMRDRADMAHKVMTRVDVPWSSLEPLRT